jgi:hypothetical protein
MYQTLNIRHIPAWFPSVDFEDQKFIYNSRVVKTPEMARVTIETPKKHATVDNPVYRKLLVQTQVYNNYQLELWIKEHVNIDLVKDAESVRVITSEGDIIDCKVTEINYEKLEGNYTFHCVLTFYSLADNEKSINTYLTSDWLNQRFGINLHRLTFECNQAIDDFVDGEGGTYTFYTRINPIFDVTKNSENSILTLGNGLKLNTRVQDSDTIILDLFLNEDELILFKNYADKCFFKDSITKENKGTVFTYLNRASYTAVEAITYDVQSIEELINCYYVIVRLKYNVRNFKMLV